MRPAGLKGFETMKCAHCDREIHKSERAVAHLGGCILNCGTHAACSACAPLGYTLTYEQRAAQTFQPGDIVWVGPAYQSGGSYKSSGNEGLYVVERRMGSDLDYELVRVRVEMGGDPMGRARAIAHNLTVLGVLAWDLMVHNTRLIPVEVK